MTLDLTNSGPRFRTNFRSQPGFKSDFYGLESRVHVPTADILQDKPAHRFQNKFFPGGDRFELEDRGVRFDLGLESRFGIQVRNKFETQIRNLTDLDSNLKLKPRFEPGFKSGC